MRAVRRALRGLLCTACMAGCAAPQTLPDPGRPQTPILTGAPSQATDAEPRPADVAVEVAAPACAWAAPFERMRSGELEAVWLVPPSRVGSLRGHYAAEGHGSMTMTWERRDEHGRTSGIDTYVCGPRGIELRMADTDGVALSFEPGLTVLSEPGVAGSTSGRALYVSGDTVVERPFEHAYEARDAAPPLQFGARSARFVAISSTLELGDDDSGVTRWETDTVWIVEDDAALPIERTQRVTSPDGRTVTTQESADWWGLSMPNAPSGR